MCRILHAVYHLPLPPATYLHHPAIIGVGIEKKDSGIIRNAGFLFRSIASKAWEDLSLTLRQIDQVGMKSIKVCRVVRACVD